MGLLETTGMLKAEATAKVILVVDASESAREHWSEIASVVDDVLSNLPASVGCSLYFLGNPSPYQPSQFAMRKAQWYADNCTRASIITPIFETLTMDEGVTIAIIGSGKIFDLDDWEGTSLLRQTLLVSMGDSLQGEPALAEEIVRPTWQQLCQRLHDPIISVEIFGAGFMPTWWDNSGYRLRIANGKVSLNAEHLNDYSITLRFFVEANFDAQSRLTHASGKETVATIRHIEPSAIKEPELTPLTQQEEEIFCNAIKKVPFTCPHCANQHSWDTLYCLSGATILGELIYPSLSKKRASGFVLFRRAGCNVFFQCHGCEVLRISEGCVAVREGKRATIYRYDERERCWLPTGQVLSAYHSVGEDVHAIII